MNTSSTTAILKAGATLPPKLLGDILGEAPIAVSYAVAKDGAVEVLHLDGLEFDVGENFAMIREEHADRKITFKFYNGNDQVPEIDQQPFVILKDGDKDLLVAFLEGEFPAYKGKEHSPEFHVVQTDLSEMIKAIYQEKEESLLETMKTLETPMCRRSMLSMLRPNGSITLVAAVHDPVVYSVGGEGAEYSFGYISRTHGYLETPLKDLPKVVEADSSKPKSYKDLLKEKQAAKKPVHVTDKGTAVNVADLKTTTSVPAISQKPDPKKLLHPPTTLHGKKLRQWYTKNFNVPLPHLWNKRCGMEAAHLRDGSPLWHIVMGSGVTPVEEPDDETDEVIEETKPVTEAPGRPAVITDPLPIVGPLEKKKIVDRKISPVPASQIQEQETKHKPFSEQIAERLENILLWDYVDYHRLSHDALATLANEFRYKIIHLQPGVIAAAIAAPAKAEPAKELTYKEKLQLKQQQKKAS